MEERRQGDTDVDSGPLASGTYIGHNAIVQRDKPNVTP